MDEFFKRAIANVIRHGDTDIFPFPVENHIFFDKPSECLALLKDIHRDFDLSLSRYPPAHDAALAPVNYTGFRWATQIDPLSLSSFAIFRNSTLGSVIIDLRTHYFS
jgi:hypothetical protein